MRTSGKIFIAALTGAVAGGVAGLLLAPESGEETRKKLNKQAQKARDELNDLVEKGKSTVDDLKKKKASST